MTPAEADRYALSVLALLREISVRLAEQDTPPLPPARRRPCRATRRPLTAPSAHRGPS